MNGIDNFREKIIQAKREYETRYVVSVRKTNNTDMELLVNILSCQDILDVAMTPDRTKILIVCKNHKEAREIVVIFNEAFGYCASII